MANLFSEMNSEQTARKQNFTNKTNQQIAVYKNLLAALDICERCIRQFDNKVANIRLVKVMEEGKSPEKLIFSLEYDKWNNYPKICIKDYQNRVYKTTVPYAGNQIDEYNCEIRIITSSQGRIDARETVKLIHKDAKEYLKNQIELCEDDLRQYDEEQTAWFELKKQVEAYSKKYSYRLRGDIEMRKK